MVICAGCLGTRRCWVCLGTGSADTHRQLGVCSSCLGSRLCGYCDPTQPPEAPPDDSLIRADLERRIVDAPMPEPM